MFDEFHRTERRIMMNTIKRFFQTAFFTALIGSTVSAENYKDLYSADLNINPTSENLASYLKTKNEGWFAYTIPAAPKSHSMCCFNQGKQTACDLTSNKGGFWSSDDSPYTSNIHVFVDIQKGQVNQIMPVGDHCEVKGNGIMIDWFMNINQKQSIQWLKEQAVENGRNDSLYVLSLHYDQAAADALFDLANKNADDYSEDAVFWLGQRDFDGFDRLKSLYQNLPKGQVRRKINFALSQNQQSEATDLLKSIAQHDEDSEQQADAISVSYTHLTLPTTPYV